MLDIEVHSLPASNVILLCIPGYLFTKSVIISAASFTPIYTSACTLKRYLILRVTRTLVQMANDTIFILTGENERECVADEA